MQKRHLIWAGMASLFLIWGSTYLAIRVVVEAVPPFLMAGARFVLAGAILYVVARGLGASSPTRKEWRAAFKAGALLLVAGNGLVCFAEQSVGSGMAALLMATIGPQLVLLGWATGRGRPNRLEFVALGVGLVGVAVLVGPTLTGGAWFPTAVLLLAAGARAGGSLVLEGGSLPRSATMASAVSMFAGGLQLLLVGAGAGEIGRLDLTAIDQPTVLAFLWLLVGGSLAAGTAYTWLLRNTARSLVASYSYVNPVVAVFLGWALMDEVVGWNTAIGAATILTSVAVLASGRSDTGEKPAVGYNRTHDAPARNSRLRGVPAARVRAAGPAGAEG